MRKHMINRNDRGFAIVAVTILMAGAIVLIAATTLETSRNLNMVRQTEDEVYAKLLARSGIERAIVEITSNLSGYNGTPMQEVENRRVYLVAPPERLNNQIRLVSTGVANGVAQQMSVTIALETGVSGVFDKAIYAGNVPPDPSDKDNPPPENLNYILKFGGSGDDADQVFGDVYSGNDVEIDDDATINPASEESFTDVNGNGLYDRGDYLSLDINGNGQFDPGVSETFEDANGNGVFDEGETFNDMNGNGVYDAAEEFIDYDSDNVFDQPEPFDDANGNGRYDYGLEAAGDVTYPGEPDAKGGDAPLDPPDIFSMDYAHTADINVSDRFGGIDSGVLPEDDAAHIFVKNPRDGRENIVDQVFMLDGKPINPDDYFLEDPYEHVNTGSQDSSDNATRISLSGGPAGKEEDGNYKTYFIDGNLYLHNLHTYSFKIQDAENKGVGVTFVVRGNIILSDNFYYRNINKDQVAFVAIRREDDPKGEISGNIYIGDENFGTIAHLQSLLYAENNFYDNNLDEEGSAHFDIYGTMTAGNQIRINRDYVIPGHYEWRRIRGRWQRVWVDEEARHSAMEVVFDDRYVDGPNGRERITPGLPSGPRQDTTVSPRVAATQYAGRVDVPSEYYQMYGDNTTSRDQ
ncbi:MAG: hypothetical protein J7M12_05440 [Candidatus Hydrogenedentes bacterium]|nr:hypothetical protein [Candidatus Hydrogenedentota bacterium]